MGLIQVDCLTQVAAWFKSCRKSLHGLNITFIITKFELNSYSFHYLYSM